MQVDEALQNVETLAGLDLAVVLQRRMTAQKKGKITAARPDLEHGAKIRIATLQLLVEREHRKQGGKRKHRRPVRQIGQLKHHRVAARFDEQRVFARAQAAKLEHVFLESVF